MSCESGTGCGRASPVPTSVGPVERSRLALRERDGAFAYFLQPVVLELHLVVEAVRRSAPAARQLGGEVTEEHVQPLQVGVLVRDHLAQKSVQVQERLDLAPPVLCLVLVFLATGGEARHRRIERGVHGLVVPCALPSPRLEIDRAEPLDLLVEIDARRIQLALDHVHARRVHFLAHLGAFVVDLERVLDLLAVVDEVEDERVFLARMHAVQPGERLHRLYPREALVHVHRMQEGLVEPGLILLRDQQHPILLRGEPLGQLLLGNAVVHARLGPRHARDLVVLHRAGESHQRLDGVALLLDVAVEALLVAHRFEARARHHHRLGPAADPVSGDGLKMLDHHLGLLRDVVRMHAS